MDELTLTSIKIIFLLGFTLHNIEEAVWLPKWSKNAGRYHEPVESEPFIFAVIIVTMIGYFITGFDILYGNNYPLLRYVYLGFTGMMGLNAIFPHMIATIVIKKYCPGLITGLVLNFPFALIILLGYIQNDYTLYLILLSILIVSGIILFSLKYLFKIGKYLHGN